MLAELPDTVDPRLIVGLRTGDDAAVYKIRDDLAMVQTVDFFLPIVDDAFDFGRVAAANALSDVYAMGADPVLALAVIGWPRSVIPMEVAAQVMAGGAAVCAEAGIQIVGGHSIDDPEPKFGLVVSGLVHPDQVLRNSGAKAGDQLVLTKPIGIGALAQGVKKGLVGDDVVARIVEVMTHLNRAAAEAAREVGVHAATDVTGFSLLGHTLEMTRGAELGATVWVDQVPILEGARELVEQGVSPGATSRNLAHFGESLKYSEAITDADLRLLADPQTSGGLLFAVAPDRAQALCDALTAHGALASAVVGEMTEGSGLRLCRRG